MKRNKHLISKYLKQIQKQENKEKAAKNTLYRKFFKNNEF